MVRSPRTRLLALSAVFALVWLPLLLVRLVWPGLTTQPQWIAEIPGPLTILMLVAGTLLGRFDTPRRAGVMGVIASSVFCLAAVARYAAGSDFVGVIGAIEVAVALAATSLITPGPVRPLIIPGLVWLVASTTAAITIGATSLTIALGIALAVLSAVPGPLLATVRRIRQADRGVTTYFRERFQEVKQELADARQIHESVFPKEKTEGSVRFVYRYEPMSMIGGDYLHAHTTRTEDGTDEVVSIAVLDVTGHGIPAALTVNRLHGELTRLYAENPRIAPGEVLAKLNSYVYLTLADHTVFVTGIVFRIDPTRSTLEYASGGHPPAFLKRGSGTILELGATSLVIGLLDATEFDPDPQEVPFGPGDALIAYTDGATECKDARGEMLGIEGLRRTFQTGWAETDGRWPATMARTVERFRNGPPDDDTLIVEVYRAFGAARAGARSVPQFTTVRESKSGSGPQPARDPVGTVLDTTGTPAGVSEEPTE